MKRFSVNRIDTSNLRGDLTGGVTAAVFALPLALAFGVASGAGPVAGMYGAILIIMQLDPLLGYPGPASVKGRRLFCICPV